MNGIGQAICLAALMAALETYAHSQQFCDEMDFRVARSADDIVITGHTGISTNARIPPQMHGLPVVEIGERAFANRRLTSVVTYESVMRIGDEAFSNNQLASVARMGHGAFAGSQITSIAIDDNVDVHTFSGLPCGFVSLYQNQGQRAGTYVLNDRAWAFEPRL